MLWLLECVWIFEGIHHVEGNVFSRTRFSVPLMMLVLSGSKDCDVY